MRLLGLGDNERMSVEEEKKVSYCTSNIVDVNVRAILWIVEDTVDMLVLFKDKLDLYRLELFDLLAKVEANVPVLLRKSKKDTFCSMLGITEPTGVDIQVPKLSKNKGTGSHSRWKNMDELIQIEYKASKKRRTCFACGKAEGHNSITCSYKDTINVANKRTTRSTRSSNVNYNDMAPSSSLFLIFDMHYDGTFNFMPLRYDNGDEVKSRRKTCIKDASNMSVEELVSWAEEEAGMASKACDDDIIVNSIVDKGKGLADKGKGLVDKDKGLVDKGKRKMIDERNAGRKFARSRNSGVIIEENVTLLLVRMGNTDFESEYFDKSIDYLSEGEDELISLRKRNIEAKNPNPNPFTILENDQANEKFLIHDEQTHWKMRKPKVGEKYVDADQLKEYLTYYSLANGFSLWFYRSSKDQVIARCGLRPKKLKDIKKGSKGNTTNILVLVEMSFLIAHLDVMVICEDIDIPTGYKIMAKFKKANPGAHEYLIKMDHKTWSRAFFMIGSNCEAIENGFSECFNLVLLLVRNKPLITMLESMRLIVMERFWHVIPGGGNIFEVRNGSEAFRVDEQHRTCTCKMWQLTGIETGTIIGLVGVESSAGNETVRSSSNACDGPSLGTLAIDGPSLGTLAIDGPSMISSSVLLSLLKTIRFARPI
nr:pentatricopeptide repeat-containing protein [Tanacetum cinerariifolium]